MPSDRPRPVVDVRRAGDRFRTLAPGLDTRHSFSAGRHYDPGNTSHGVLVAHDEHRVEPGAGFAAHRHVDTEIVSWVVEGSLLHEDSTGSAQVLRPGRVQRLSAGRGVVHSETNPGQGRLQVVQMWVLPDESGTEPAYDQSDVGDRLRSGELVPMASGRAAHAGAAALRIANRSAALHAARLPAGGSAQLPDAPYLHVFLVRGAAHLEAAGALGAGDAVRLAPGGGQRVTATEPAELLVWEMHARA